MLSWNVPVLFSEQIDTDAAAWGRNVYAAGGSYTQSTLRAVSRLSKALKKNGLWGKMLAVAPRAGNDLTSARVRLKVPAGVAVSETNNNFVAGDYVETGASGGLIGNGTTKYLDTLINPSTLSYDVSSFGLWTYRMTAVVGTGSSRASMGSNGLTANNSTVVGWLNGGLEESGAVAANAAVPTVYAGRTGTSFNGFVGVTTNGSRTQTLYRNGSLSGLTVIAAAAFHNGNIYAHASNLNGTAGIYNVRREGSSFITTGFSAGEVVVFNSIVQAFESNLERSV
jgi:hypothetical protein